MGKKGKEIKKKALLAFKIGVGSFAAIYFAELLGVQFAASAGIVTLLTTVSTKWETVKLAGYRILTFFLSSIVAIFLFSRGRADWLMFGVYMFLLVFLSGIAGLSATVSVNAVIGTHYLTSMDFSFEFVINEFLIVLIGITIATILNLFQPYRSQKGSIIAGMRDTEEALQKILKGLSTYLKNDEETQNPWEEIEKAERNLAHYTESAYEYQDNTFVSHPEYYIYYFEMRMKQLNLLQNLHGEMQKIRKVPEDASLIANFILKLREHTHEMSDMAPLLEELEYLLDQIKKHPLPCNTEDVEGAARIYHILMDLEDFLLYKVRFVESLEDRHFEIYWNVDGLKSK
ncbi:MAG TPA: hypothetical protein H9887_02795 [Candidatus Dorea intestinavium]|nr:hypothetical protein [Candidatus Dorea intestinavium]